MDSQVDVVMIFPIDTLDFQQGKGVHTTLVLAILRVRDRPFGDGKVGDLLERKVVVQ